jgi:hypothetical protein
LFFCFRWILISFKREFEFQDVLKVWEAVSFLLPLGLAHTMLSISDFL